MQQVKSFSTPSERVAMIALLKDHGRAGAAGNVGRRDPKKPEFIIYLPERIEKFKDKVIERFDLPVAYVRVDTSDEHYRM
jgi:hypothetical protein